MRQKHRRRPFTNNRILRPRACGASELLERAIKQLKINRGLFKSFEFENNRETRPKDRITATWNGAANVFRVAEELAVHSP